MSEARIPCALGPRELSGAGSRRRIPARGHRPAVATRRCAEPVGNRPRYRLGTESQSPVRTGPRIIKASVKGLPEWVKYRRRIASCARDFVHVRQQLGGCPTASRRGRDANRGDSADSDALASKPGLQRKEKGVSKKDATLLGQPQIVERPQGIRSEIVHSGGVTAGIGKSARMNRDELVEILHAGGAEGKGHRAPKTTAFPSR